MRIVTTARPASLPPRLAKYVWVQWDGEPQPRKEGLPDHIGNGCAVKRYLERHRGKRMVWWQHAGGGEEEEFPVHVTFS